MVDKFSVRRSLFISFGKSLQCQCFHDGVHFPNNIYCLAYSVREKKKTEVRLVRDKLFNAAIM